MESRPSLVAQLQHLAALPAHSGPEVVQAALLTLMLDAAAAEQAMISESLARLKAIDQVRLAGNVNQDARDALGEMGETESLRLQMAMDRLSRFMTTLSNVAKKSADATAAIVQNLK